MAVILMPALAAGVWGESPEPAQHDESSAEQVNKAVDSPDLEGGEMAPASATQSREKVEPVMPAVGQRSVDTGGRLTQRQKRIFVLGLAEQEKQ